MTLAHGALASDATPFPNTGVEVAMVGPAPLPSCRPSSRTQAHDRGGDGPPQGHRQPRASLEAGHHWWQAFVQGVVARPRARADEGGSLGRRAATSVGRASRTRRVVALRSADGESKATRDDTCTTKRGPATGESLSLVLDN